MASGIPSLIPTSGGGGGQLPVPASTSTTGGEQLWIRISGPVLRGGVGHSGSFDSELRRGSRVPQSRRESDVSGWRRRVMLLDDVD
ncbi:hypothetical protein LINPERPRIM_LOCUS12241 [Linum perenne]